MKEPRKTILYWLPRILSILFALFISLFALDVFDEGFIFPEVLWALLIHMVPTMLIILTLLVAWRWEWFGTVMFAGLAGFYIIMTAFREHWSAYLAIPLPLLAIAILWLFAWRQKKRYQLAQTA
jgi:hypothetical protein